MNRKYYCKNCSKCCKINTTAYNPNKPIKIDGGDSDWPFHSQDLHTPELYKRMTEVLFGVERDTDPGLDVDSYMVVYKDTFELWKEWEKYDGQPIKRGTFHVIFEERNGGNYQMINTAYQMLKDKYEWFIFTCDDIMVFGDEYYRKILDKWEDGCGFVALQGGGELPGSLEDEPQHHVHGSIGLTNKEILEKVCVDNGGELPHSKSEWTQRANIIEGEVPFTNRMLGLGYHFINYNDSKSWKKENLCYPYYNYIHD